MRDRTVTTWEGEKERNTSLFLDISNNIHLLSHSSGWLTVQASFMEYQPQRLNQGVGWVAWSSEEESLSSSLRLLEE